MAPMKRKRSDDVSPESPPDDPSVTRATRRTGSIALLPLQADPEPRRRRQRAEIHDETDEIVVKDREDGSPTPSPTQNLQGRRPVQRATNQAQPVKPIRGARHRGAGSTNGLVAPMLIGAEDPRPGSRSSPLVGGSQAARNPFATSAVSMVQPLRRLSRTADTVPSTTAPAPQPSQPQPQPQQRPKPSQQRGPNPKSPQKEGADPEKTGSRPDRNIDKVVLGKRVFSTWYPSYFALSETSGNGGKSASGSKAGSNSNGSKDGAKDEGGSKATSRKDRDKKIDRLYVCPCCFKYSKELVPWWQHVHVCERRAFIPGEKIYVHPKGKRTKQISLGTVSKGLGRKKRGAIEEVIEDQGEWSIWVVDGEKEGMFCQNLSLFAKLFLDNKSVFYDVTGFHYFLLVYTPPVPTPDPNQDVTDAPTPKPQIVGFFSKEKMSWDNNNLACILVFPPWQRKGLGALLMGVSYEISRRENMLGGPEKPISDLGRKGYTRFWAAEIAAWILSQDLAQADGELIVDINDCSQATWIVPEDCLAVLREMGVVENAGLGPPKAEPLEEGEEEVVKEPVQRVRITKDAVRAYVKANGMTLDKACDPDGFVEGYAIQEGMASEEDEG